MHRATALTIASCLTLRSASLAGAGANILIVVPPTCITRSGAFASTLPGVISTTSLIDRMSYLVVWITTRSAKAATRSTHSSRISRNVCAALWHSTHNPMALLSSPVPPWLR